MHRQAHRAVRCLIVATLVVGAQILASQLPAPPLSRDWKQGRSDNFMVVGDARDGQLLEALGELERFRHVLLTLFPDVAIDYAIPKTMMLFGSERSFARFRPRDERGRVQTSVAGYFSMHPDAIYMVAHVMGNRADTYHVIFHEYAHYLIHRRRRPVPRWVDEGLAEFYSTFHMGPDGRGVLGRMPPWRAATLRSGAPFLSFERLFTPNGAARALRTPGERERFYAHAWALAHYSMVGKRAGQLAAYLRALDKGLTVDDAFQEAYNVSFAELQRELVAYVRDRRLPAIAVSFPDDVAAHIASVEPMREADALQVQGDLLLRIQAADEAERLLTNALRLDSGHVAARVSLAGVHRVRERPEEAIAILQAVTSEAPDDFGGHYWLGANLSREGRYEEAMRPLGRAVTLNERSADAWVELSVAAMALDRSPQAAAAFTQAQRLHPTPQWYHRRAHQLFGAARYRAIAEDVAAYVREAGWGNDSSPYMAFLGALAHWRLNEPEAADGLLAQATDAVDASSWPADVASFLRGTLTTQEFLKRGRDRREETEAQAYIGLKASTTGREDEARLHLRWVRERGSRRYIGYDLANAELRRLEAPPPAAPSAGAD